MHSKQGGRGVSCRQTSTCSGIRGMRGSDQLRWLRRPCRVDPRKSLESSPAFLAGACQPSVGLWRSTTQPDQCHWRTVTRPGQDREGRVAFLHRLSGVPDHVFIDVGHCHTQAEPAAVESQGAVVVDRVTPAAVRVPRVDVHPAPTSRDQWMCLLFRASPGFHEKFRARI